MIAKIIIWVYLILVVPPMAILLTGLIYGGVIEIAKSFTTTAPGAGVPEDHDSAD